MRFQPIGLAAAIAVCASVSAHAAAPHVHRTYTPYEQMILRATSSFHNNFNARQFAKNGELVADDLHVDSNGVPVNGRAAFVQRIARFTEPFPDVKITDVETVVDGNTAPCASSSPVPKKAISQRRRA